MYLLWTITTMILLCKNGFSPSGGRWATHLQTVRILARKKYNIHTIITLITYSRSINCTDIQNLKLVLYTTITYALYILIHNYILHNKCLGNNTVTKTMVQRSEIHFKKYFYQNTLVRGQYVIIIFDIYF